MAATPAFVGVLLLLCCPPTALSERVLDMDRLSSCASGANNEPVIVYDDPVILNAHSRSPPPNPPTSCVVMFKSGFNEADGYQRLEVVIEKVDIRDSQVFVAIFNGLGVYGNYLRNLGKNSISTDVLYTTGPEATVRLTRPSTLYQTAYDVTLKIIAYKDRNDPGTVTGVAKLSAGGIIGIVVGLLVMLVLVVLVIWCLTTGKIYEYLGRTNKSGSEEKIGADGTNLSRAASQDMSGFDHKDPVIWNTLTTGQYTPGSTPNQGRRSFRQGQNRGLPPFAGGAKPTVTVGEEDVRLTAGRQGAQWRRDSEGKTQPGEYSDVYEPGGRFRSTSHADYINSRWGSARENGGDEEGGNQQGSPGRFRRGAPPRGSRQGAGDDARASLNEKEKARLAMEGSTGTAQDNFQRSGSGRGSGRGSMRKDDPARSSKRSADGNDAEMMRRSKAEGSDDDEGIPGKKKRRPGSGLFENPDEEGYLYDYDQLHTLSGSDLAGKSGEGKDAAAKTSQVAPPSLDDSATTMSAPQATVRLDTPANMGNLDTSTDNQTGTDADAASEDTPRKESAPQKKRRSDKKKNSKKKKKGRSILDTSSIDYSDPDAMPPEASDPIFSQDSNAAYGQRRQPPGGFGYSPYQAPYGMPMMLPYGMVPMQPGMQAYAYAFQGAAPGDGQQPGTTAGQAAWVVQETPTRDGPMQKTAFMVATTTTPSNPASRQGSFRGHPGSPNHASTPAGAFDTPHRGSGRGKGGKQNPADRNALALSHGRPGTTPGHKSAIMKAGTDPDTGIHTTQTMWSDSVPDPSDPPPDANPQITRKTVTRITTRSGHAELPSTADALNFTDMFAIEPDQPDFLSPSRSVQGGHSSRALPSTITPERDNVAFYDGPAYPGHPGAPGQVVHSASRHKAIRDRVSSRDSLA